MEEGKRAREEPVWRGDDPTRREAVSREHDPARQLVLVVEDEPHDWEIYGKMLWYNGFDVLYARNGAEGLELARDHSPDLVLLDLGLPEMDGLELCRRLKEGPTAHIPVFILTARSKKKYGEQARLAGCDRYLEKPRTPLEVLSEVEAVIGQAPPGAGGRPPDEDRFVRDAGGPS